MSVYKDTCSISLNVFLPSFSLGCRALMSPLLSSATRTGFGCILWLMATTVTGDSAHIIKVGWGKCDYLHWGSFKCTLAHTHTHMQIQYKHSVFIYHKRGGMYSTCISLPLMTAFFKVLISPLLPFFLGIFVFVFLSLTVGPHHPSLSLPPNYACWLQTSCLFDGTFSLCLNLPASLSLSSLSSSLLYFFFLLGNCS